MNYIPFHVGDWDSSTRLLRPVEKGIYIDLIMLYYSVERPLMRSECDRIARAYAPDEKDALKYVLDRYFDLHDDVYSHQRCDAEIAAFRAKSEKAAKSARARWNRGSRALGEIGVDADVMRGTCGDDANAYANALRTQCGNTSKRNTKAMLTNNQYPINKKKESNKESDLFNEEVPKRSRAPKRDLVKPDDVSQEVFEEWVAFKDGFKVKCSQRMLDFIAREAEKAGISTEEAMLTAMEHGWQSFQASYIAGRTRATAPVAEPAPIDYHKGFNPDGTF